MNLPLVDIFPLHSEAAITNQTKKTFKTEHLIHVYSYFSFSILSSLEKAWRRIREKSWILPSSVVAPWCSPRPRPLHRQARVPAPPHRVDLCSREQNLGTRWWLRALLVPCHHHVYLCVSHLRWYPGCHFFSRAVQERCLQTSNRGCRN